MKFQKVLGIFLSFFILALTCGAPNTGSARCENQCVRAQAAPGVLVAAMSIAADVRGLKSPDHSSGKLEPSYVGYYGFDDLLLDDRNPSGYVQVLEEWTSTGTPVLSRVYNYGLDLISQRVPGNSTNYFIYDGHGSTRLLTDAGGNVANAFAYDAFGTLIASNGTPQTAYLYCGEQFDNDLGFYYLRARYLNPNTGRFWSMDAYEGSSSDPASLHKYLYCQANPVMGFDPSGHEGEFMSTLGAMAISSVMQGLAMSAVTRGYDAAKAFCAGQALGAIAEEAATGMGEDALLNVATLGLSKITAIRKAGQIMTRAVDSVWALGWGSRGFAIEQIVAKRFLKRPLMINGVDLVKENIHSFPVIDDFVGGTARSIKSIDLTANSYQNASALTGILQRYASKLRDFKGATYKDLINIQENDIKEKVLTVVVEPGAATSAQAQALKDFIYSAKSSYGIKVELIYTH